jgi:hypothetical protein
MDFEKDTLIVLSDHGQIDIGGHGGTEAVVLTEPFVAIGAGIIPGGTYEIQMADVAPTVAVLLGTNIPASSQGRPLIEILDVSAEENSSIMEAVRQQQMDLYNAYTTKIGREAVIKDAGTIVGAIQLALEEARMGRLASERVWRNLLSFTFLIVPAYILFLRRQKNVVWMLVGALLYLSLFNARYFLIDHKTYSVSSITGPTEFILYIAMTTGVALVISWVVSMLGLRAFRKGARNAVLASLGVIWFVLYLLTIPVLLNFSVNGVLVDWTLPVFNVLFAGFYALVQVLFVASLGLFLTGAAAVVGKIKTRS